MLGIGLILGAVLAAGVVGIVAAFWEDILNFLRGAVAYAKDVLGKVVKGVKILVRKISEGIREISKSYSQQNGQWEEITTIKTIDASKVPKDILEKASLYEDVDVTDELEMQLQSA